MGLFTNIKEKIEDGILLAAQQIAEQRANAQQQAQDQTPFQYPQVQINSDNEALQKLLNLRISKDFIIEASCMIDKDGHLAYIYHDYFLCAVPRKTLKRDEQYKVVKITGDNIGKKYTLRQGARGGRVVINSQDWYCPEMEPFIPYRSETIRDLNNFATHENKKRKAAYERNILQQQAVQSAITK